MRQLLCVVFKMDRLFKIFNQDPEESINQLWTLPLEVGIDITSS
jgi:hypothetical protein